MQKPAEQTSSALPKNKLPHIEAALATPLFGQYMPPNLSDGVVKHSGLNLTVVGILFAGREQDSQVIVLDAKGREQVFRVGDKLPGDAVIKRITAQGVLILRNGVLESLVLPKNELILQPPVVPMNHMQE